MSVFPQIPRLKPLLQSDDEGGGGFGRWLGYGGALMMGWAPQWKGPHRAPSPLPLQAAACHPGEGCEATDPAGTLDMGVRPPDCETGMAVVEKLPGLCHWAKLLKPHPCSDVPTAAASFITAKDAISRDGAALLLRMGTEESCQEKQPGAIPKGKPTNCPPVWKGLHLLRTVPRWVTFTLKEQILRLKVLALWQRPHEGSHLWKQSRWNTRALRPVLQEALGQGPPGTTPTLSWACPHWDGGGSDPRPQHKPAGWQKWLGDPKCFKTKHS